jgi:ATP-binding cassette subfamily F protein 3
VKALAGELPLAKGRRSAAANLRIGYFAQHQLEQLDMDASPIAQLQRVDPQAREQDLRDYLGGFDFRGDAVNASIARFSGGEKARLVLALIVRARPQLLILDEPTNHLDIEMREALSEALQDYNGALLVVAHDRHLLAATTDELWLVDGGAVAPFEGDLDDYRDWVLSARPRKDPTESSRVAVPDRKQQKRDEAQTRQRRSDARKPWLAEQKRLESDIENFNTEKRELDDWLASPEAYDAAAKDDLVVALERQGEVAWKLARAEAAWLEVQEKLDALE